MAKVSKLSHMTFDEVSLVRRPANQHASIVFSKADEGDLMPGTIITEDGQEIAIDDLELGTEVEIDGEVFTVVEDDGQEGEPGEQVGGFESQGDDQLYYEEDEDYGKSDDYVPPGKYAEMISKAYTEAVNEDERAQLVAEVAKSAEYARLESQKATDHIAKMQQEAYVEQCISKADDYGFAGPRTQEFGVALSKMMTVLDPSEIQLMDDIFKAFSELIDEVTIGQESDGYSEVMDLVDSSASEIVKSSGGDVSPEQAMAAAFDANPDLYSLYLAEKDM
jgi:hypothetical protein